MSFHAELDEALKAVAPAVGASFGKEDDKSTWRVDFAPEATQEQRAAAMAVVDAFDVAAATARAERLRQLVESDAKLSGRAIEDVIAALIKKGALAETDLPAELRDTLADRKVLRASIPTMLL